jgi:hypothetical protein
MAETPDFKLARFLRFNYGMLLVVLMGVLLVYPFVGDSRTWRFALGAAVLTLMGAALVAVWGDRKLFYGALAVAVASKIFIQLGQAGASVGLLQVGLGLRAVFYFAVIVSILNHVLRSHRVTMRTVFGACCVYLLVGVAWSDLFMLVDLAYPGSFSVGSPEAASWTIHEGVVAAREFELLYYSLITLTTIGYGDMVPLSPQGRMMAAIEGIIAQLYLAIIVARLVGMELAERRNRSE